MADSDLSIALDHPAYSVDAPFSPANVSFNNFKLFGCYACYGSASRDMLSLLGAASYLEHSGTTVHVFSMTDGAILLSE